MVTMLTNCSCNYQETSVYATSTANCCYQLLEASSYMCTSAYAHVGICMWSLYIYIYIYIYLNKYVCACMYLYIYIYIYMYVYMSCVYGCLMMKYIMLYVFMHHIYMYTQEHYPSYCQQQAQRTTLLVITCLASYFC